MSRSELRSSKAALRSVPWFAGRHALVFGFVGCLAPHQRQGTAGAPAANDIHAPAADGARTFRFALGEFAEREHCPLIQIGVLKTG